MCNIYTIQSKRFYFILFHLIYNCIAFNSISSSHILFQSLYFSILILTDPLLSILLSLLHYSTLWPLSSNKTRLHSFRSLVTTYQFLIPIIFKSSSTSSVHLSVDFLFSIFLLFWLSLFLLALFRYSAFLYAHSVLTCAVLYVLRHLHILICSYSPVP